MSFISCLWFPFSDWINTSVEKAIFPGPTLCQVFQLPTNTQKPQSRIKIYHMQKGIITPQPFPEGALRPYYANTCFDDFHPPAAFNGVFIVIDIYFVPTLLLPS